MRSFHWSLLLSTFNWNLFVACETQCFGLIYFGDQFGKFFDILNDKDIKWNASRLPGEVLCHDHVHFTAKILLIAAHNTNLFAKSTLSISTVIIR